MRNFEVLGSSSAGNAGLLRTGYTTVLIDAGFSAKRIERLLEARGLTLDAVDAVFLTHEHNDHAAGIRGIARQREIPVFANRATAEAVQTKLKSRPNWHLFESGATFEFRDLTVNAFTVPHDAYDPVGFTFHWGEDDLFSKRSSLGWITDLGYIPQLVRHYAETVECLFVEANYDEDLLEKDTRRPWATKQRIRSRHGHLSNQACFEFIESLNPKCALRSLIIGHLSRDCNCLNLVRSLFSGLGRPSLGVEVVDPAEGEAVRDLRAAG